MSYAWKCWCGHGEAFTVEDEDKDSLLMGMDVASPDSVVVVTERLFQLVGHQLHGFEMLAKGGQPGVKMALAGMIFLQKRWAVRLCCP